MANDFYNSGDDNNSYHKTVALCVAAASMVVLLFLVVLYVKSDDKKHAVAKNQVQEEVQEENVLDEAHNFTSDELDFWKDQDNGLDEVTKDPEGEVTPYKGDSSKKSQPDENDNEEDLESEDESKNVDKTEKDRDDADDSMNDDADDDSDMDGNHLAVTDAKGTKKYYEILSKLSKNDYDFKEYLSEEDGKLKYNDNKREAVMGVDLSKYNGEVDFAKAKESGVEFAMLRLGSRGYGTGVISLDEKFVNYAQNAALNNIPIGAYFYSQAISEAEAVEEANYIVGAVSGFTIKYPIAIDIEIVTEDESRTEKLTVKERTAIVKAFCDTVKSFGYKPAIYATRDMLIAGLDLEQLEGIDVWLADTNRPTDYPYKFTMWQYSNKGKIEGINGQVSLNMSFVNYEQR